MKKIILISLLVIFGISSFGQKIRFTDSTNRWRERDFQRGGGGASTTDVTNPVFYSSDTIINSKRYMNLVDGAPVNFIREDSLAKKVYIRALYDTVDYLLYDYNLTIGDTLTNNVLGYGTLSSWVIGIDSTRINGIWYKIWYFKGGNFSTGDYYYHVIEGIGCMNGLVLPVDWSLQSGYPFNIRFEQIFCFQNQGIAYPLSNPVHIDNYYSSMSYVFDNAASCTLHAGNIVKKESGVFVSPNPIDPSSKITFPNNISSGSVAIFNDLGQSVLNLPFQNKEEILIGDKIKTLGIYYYRVIDNENGQAYSGKFIYR